MGEWGFALGALFGAVLTLVAVAAGMGFAKTKGEGK